MIESPLLNISGIFTLPSSLAASVPLSLGCKVCCALLMSLKLTSLGVTVSLRAPLPTAARSPLVLLVLPVLPRRLDLSLRRTLNDCSCQTSLSHLSSLLICSMILSHIIGKYADSGAPRLPPPRCRPPPAKAEKVKTFLEKRSGIFEAVCSKANWCRLVMMNTTPKQVQPAWYHKPVSATKRQKLILQRRSHSRTSEPQLVLYQTREISEIGSRPKRTKSNVMVSSATALKITRDI
mmetsp:Transcript_138291/g.350535  ORF Transcript_138291/g.350535 Transcript_138291/m.350535 type:complete len:236 (-) Transcript_138291:360-1067(-)